MGGAVAVGTAIVGAVGSWLSAAGGVAGITSAVSGVVGTLTGLKNLVSDESSPVMTRIESLPAYNEKATIEETKLVDKLLSQVKGENKKQIQDFERRMRGLKDELLNMLKKDIGTFKKHGLNTDFSIFEDCFNSLKKLETLSELLNKRFSISDKECLKIIGLKDGKEKGLRFREFRMNVLLDGIETYFNEISDAASLIFKFIASDVAQRVEQMQKENLDRVQTIQKFSGTENEKKKEKKEIQVKLDALRKLENYLV